MSKNMGNVDRAIRILVAIAIAVLYYTGRISGTVAAVLALLAVVFLVTSAIGYCPLYKAVGLSTRKDA